MANIHTQIKDGKLEVTHQGESKVFALPEWMRLMGEGMEGEESILQDADKMVDHLKENNVQINTLGNLSDLPEDAAGEMKQAMESTVGNTGLNGHAAETTT